MSSYPPFPFFTFVGFLTHSLAMLSIAVHLLKRRSSRAVTYLGVSALLFAIDFSLITILFFLFPNAILKTHLFIFIASVIVPTGTLMLVVSLSAVSQKWEKLGLVIFAIGLAAVLYSYFASLPQFRDIAQIQYSYVHPAYPLAITANQGIGGFIGALIVALFFFYHAFRSTWFVKRRAITIGIASLLLAMSSLYWLSSSAPAYLFTHIVGPLGSILFWVALFMIKVPDESKSGLDS